MVLTVINRMMSAACLPTTPTPPPPARCLGPVPWTWEYILRDEKYFADVTELI